MVPAIEPLEERYFMAATPLGNVASYAGWAESLLGGTGVSLQDLLDIARQANLGTLGSDTSTNPGPTNPKPTPRRAPLGVGLSAKATSPSRIDLAWTGAVKAGANFTVYQKDAGTLAWVPLGSVPASARSYAVSGLAPGSRYSFRLGTGSGQNASYSRAAAATTPGQPIVGQPDIHYGGPITITHGGTYSGNWQSDDPNTPAVRVRTSEPVIIQNSHIRSRSSGIDASGYAANLTVRNTYGYGLNPNVRGRYPGRFLDIDGFTNLVATNNYLEGTSGIYLYNYLGNHSASQTVKVLGNVAHNIDGRYSDGRGGFLTGPDDNYYVQFFQINGIQGLTGAEVGWNQIINDPGQSRVEENINIFASGGTPASPFAIHDNYIFGAYPANYTNDTSYTGGGIMLSDIGSAWTRAYNNQIINTGSQGITVSSGHDNVFYGNRILSTGLLPDGRPMPYSNVGATIWNYNHEKTFRNNGGWNNLIGWMSDGARNSSFVPDAANWNNNTDWPGAITSATLAGEWTLWQQKLANAHMKIGPA